MNVGATKSASPIVAPSQPSEPRGTERMALRCATHGIKKTFGQTAILKGVDLEIPEGAFAVLVGPSGCGKSTLLRLLAGLEQADEGSILLKGRDVTRLPPRDRDIAMVFQSYALYPHLTVRDNLAFGLRLRGTPANEIAARIEEASAMLGLSTLLDRLPKQLSGGQRQRVAMGRAIVRRPTLFLFDEPLSNLDAALRAEVRVEIRRLHERLGATTVYVTHDQTEAMTLADSLWVLNAGRVEQRGAPLEIYDAPRTKFVAAFLGSPQMNFLSGTLALDKGALRANADGLSARVSREKTGIPRALFQGQPATIGIRPHDVSIALAPEEAACELTVDFIEALGSEAFAHGTLGTGGLPFIARLDASDARRLGPKSRVPLSVRPESVHLFDPTSERSMLHEP